MGDLQYHTDSKAMDCPCFCENEKSSHYKRICLYCSKEWKGLHCPHDGYQNPCPHCGIRPKTIK